MTTVINKGKFMQCKLKHSERNNTYKNSTGTCLVIIGNEERNIKAYSYGWWLFVSKINDNLVFNTYTYSVTTRAHQSSVRRLIEDTFGLTINIFIEAPEGLDKPDKAIEHYQRLIEATTEEMNSPRKRQATKDRLKTKIEHYNKMIQTIKQELYV